ncbi:hypothetical protein ACTUVN_002377 [Pseudomonas caspiana]
MIDFQYLGETLGQCEIVEARENKAEFHVQDGKLIVSKNGVVLNTYDAQGLRITISSDKPLLPDNVDAVSAGTSEAPKPKKTHSIASFSNLFLK